MSITFDNITIDESTYSTSTGGGTVLTQSHETDGFYRGLVFAAYTNPSYVNNGTVTYGGEELTRLPGGQVNLYTWYLTNPPKGDNDLIITSTDRFYIYGHVIASYNGVLQSGMYDSYGTETDSGGAFAFNVNPTVADTWIITTTQASGNGTWSNGTNLVYRDSNGIFGYGDSNGSVGAAGSKTVSGAADTGNNVYGLGFSIKPDVLLPLLSTSAVNNIGLQTARFNGNVEYDGDTTVIERGFVYDTNTLPTIDDTKVLVPGTEGDMLFNESDLTVNETYYVRAFATNSYGTAYGEEVTFDTLNITSTDIVKDIGAIEGEEYAVSVDVGGTTGNVTVKLGTTGTSQVMTAGGGVQTFQGTYSGSDGIIITKDGTFDGTIDDVMWVRIDGSGTIDWTLDSYTTVFPISSEVVFRRIEDDVFNSFRFYRYLDLLFKDLDGYVTVGVRSEANNGVTTASKEFSVGNTASPASPFVKRRISFLSKNQAIIISLSNAKQDETFSIAQFLLEGSGEEKKLSAPGNIISVS